MTPKSWTIQAKVDKGNEIRRRCFVKATETIIGVKGQTTRWKRDLQIVYLT
jgi:hypothetical protein